MAEFLSTSEHCREPQNMPWALEGAADTRGDPYGGPRWDRTCVDRDLRLNGSMQPGPHCPGTARGRAGGDPQSPEIVFHIHWHEEQNK